ncbi:hypothetical protein DRO59_08955 [Candidatus Bathyarchaeota archaeon]|nr:MAG: hypothetical protein DRO59_08955 [Candidatus Bathyarchaeota archaeon]
MAKNPEPPVRVISILVGIAIGCILAYAYQVNLPTLFYETYVWASLVVFVTIPVLAGFVSGLLHPAMAMKNGLYVGFFSGLFNSVLATVKLIYAPALVPNEVYAFSVFAIMSIFIWTFLAAAASVLAEKFYE